MRSNFASYSKSTAWASSSMCGWADGGAAKTRLENKK